MAHRRGRPDRGVAVVGVSLGGFASQRQAWLARRQPHARNLYAERLQVDDVVHAPSGPLEVVEPPQAHDDGWISVVVLDYYPDGSPFENRLRHEARRELLVSRPSKLPRHLQDPEWVSAAASASPRR